VIRTGKLQRAKTRHLFFRCFAVGIDWLIDPKEQRCKILTLKSDTRAFFPCTFVVAVDKG